MTWINLEERAADRSQKIIEAGLRAAIDQKKQLQIFETLTTQCIGVLEENGVYACTLFLLSRKERQIAETTLENLFALLDDPMALPRAPVSAGQRPDYLSQLRQVTDNLDVLLMIKTLWQQTLVYTRYGLKARRARL
jgi:hypothetical protein